MSTKSHTYKTYGTLRKASICMKGYAKIHIRMPFLDNKRHMRDSCIENLNGGDMLCYLLCTQNFCFLKTPKSQFLLEF
jgi:hypothetical protein